jgi:hypothetical protein
MKHHNEGSVRRTKSEDLRGNFSFSPIRNFSHKNINTILYRFHIFLLGNKNYQIRIRCTKFCWDFREKIFSTSETVCVFETIIPLLKIAFS